MNDEWMNGWVNEWVEWKKEKQERVPLIPDIKICALYPKIWSMDNGNQDWIISLSKIQRVTEREREEKRISRPKWFESYYDGVFFMENFPLSLLLNEEMIVFMCMCLVCCVHDYTMCSLRTNIQTM